MGYEAQVMWHKYIYMGLENPSLFPLKLHVCIHKKSLFVFSRNIQVSCFLSSLRLGRRIRSALLFILVLLIM